MQRCEGSVAVTGTHLVKQLGHIGLVEHEAMCKQGDTRLCWSACAL